MIFSNLSPNNNMNVERMLDLKIEIDLFLEIGRYIIKEKE
jgi:hypothetical protein